MDTVTLPLAPNRLVNFFKNKKSLAPRRMLIHYKDTIKNFNDRAIILYTANLDINCEFTEISAELLYEYMTVQDFCNCIQLLYIHANVLCYFKFGKVLYPESLDLFNLDDIIKFCITHPEVITKQCEFLDSMPLYFISRIQSIQDVENVELNTDDSIYSEIGFNIINLCDFEDFLIRFSSIGPSYEKQVYYSKYFDEYMFKGKNLFDYVSNCAYLGLLTYVIYQVSSSKELETNVT